MVSRDTLALRRMAESRAELVRFSRFFNNPKVTPAEILASAAARTAEAAAGRHVLLIEDSTQINFQAKAGRKRALGRIGNGAQLGLFIHPALAVDAADETVLGIAAAQIWRRFHRKAADYKSQPTELKESQRWIATLLDARQALGEAALVTGIADREGDIYELFARVPDARTHLLVRCAQNRRLGEGGLLFERLAAFPEACRVSLALPARPGQPARTATLVVRFGQISLRKPEHGADRRDPAQISLAAIEVCEIDPPAGVKPIHWRLLTTHAVSSAEDALSMIELYRRRWIVEQLFRTLKSQALDIEQSFVEDGAALERLAAAALVAATTTLQLVQGRGEAGRALPASRVFSPTEVETLQLLVPQLEGKTLKQKNPHPVHTLAWAAWVIARLGGWMGYASERPPGPITMFHGLQRFHAMAQGYALAKHHFSPQALYDVCKH